MSVLGICNTNGKRLAITYCQCNNCEAEKAADAEQKYLLTPDHRRTAYVDRAGI